MPNMFRMTRTELVAHLAAIGNRIQRTQGPIPISRIADYITQCANEFNLNNEEQQMFLKFIANGNTDYTELLKTLPKEENDGNV